VLTVVAGLIVLDGVLPWERYCGSGFGGFPRQCFDAAIWSGSASLIGQLGEALALAFVVLSSARGWARSGRVPLAGVGLGAAVIAATAVKFMMVAVDASQTAANSLTDTRFVGAWLGLVLVLIGAGLLIAVVGRGPSVLWRSAVATVACLVVAGPAVPYSLSGLAWWGGPLSEPRYLGGGNGIGITLQPGQVAAFSGLIYARNGGRVTATLDRLDFVGKNPSFRVRESFAGPSARCGVGELVHGQPTARMCGSPLAGREVPPGPGPRNEVDLGAFVSVRRPGLYRTGWFRVRYHVGPLHFEMFNVGQLKLCAPEPGHRSCPGY
jgi:hypothetical protein